MLSSSKRNSVANDKDNTSSSGSARRPKPISKSVFDSHEPAIHGDRDVSTAAARPCFDEARLLVSEVHQHADIGDLPPVEMPHTTEIVRLRLDEPGARERHRSREATEMFNPG